MEQNREITVKGIGSLKASADCVELSMSLSMLRKDYSEGYEEFTYHLERLQKFVCSAGFGKKDIKTKRISITTEYESVKQNGVYKDVFKGYDFSTELKVTFDFDSKLLGEVLKAIASSGTNPKTRVIFTVRDKEAAKNKLLENAAKDARTKAEILCAASGVKLGRLMSIHYNWDELEIFSHTDYTLNSELSVGSAEIDFTPDDIDLEDNASFVWEICD